MTLIEVLFYVFAAIALASGLFILLTRNVIYAAFSLILTFLSMAALFVLAGADFIAVVQIIVYAGGILVLMIFGVMLTTRLSGQKIMTATGNRWLGMGLVVGLFAILFSIFLRVKISSIAWIKEVTDKGETQIEGTVETIGIRLMSDYMLPFELAAILLLIALMGAALIAKGGIMGKKIRKET